MRKALNYAIDRNAIVKLAYSGHATPGSSYMPYKMQYWNSSLKPYPYDPAKAKAILSQVEDTRTGFKTFLIEVANDVAGNATAVVIKSELAKIGINVDIKTYELLTAYAKEDGGHSQMGQRYWTNDIIDPDEVTTFGVDPKGGANAFSTYWGDPTATKLVHQARGELDPAKRRADVQADPADRLRPDAVPGPGLQPVPLRGRQLGARVPRHPARQLQPVPGDAHGRPALAPRQEGRADVTGRFGFLGRRLLQLIPVLLGITILTFFLLRLVPGDPARQILGQHYTPKAAAEIHHKLGLDQPLWTQYMLFMERLVHGNLGDSIYYNQSARSLIAERLPPTLFLVAYAGVSGRADLDPDRRSSRRCAGRHLRPGRRASARWSRSRCRPSGSGSS